MIDEATVHYLRMEAIHHCSQVWPTIMEYKWSRDVSVLDRANGYLGQLKSDDLLIYNIVMEMLSKRSGADWGAIRDAVS